MGNVKSDLKIISGLITGNESIPKYMVDTFKLFCIEQKTIVINMEYLADYCPSYLLDLIFYSFDGALKEVDVGSKSNIIRETVWNMFPNITNIIIYCTEWDGS